MKKLFNTFFWSFISEPHSDQSISNIIDHIPLQMILLMLRLDILKSVVMLVGLFSYSRLFKPYLMI